MSKPRHTLYRRCEYEGCGDTGIVECSSAKERLSELAKFTDLERERDEALCDAAAAREEARRMGELLVEYHDELRDAQWGTEWECPSCRRVANLGHYRECSIGNLLARWPEVKP